MKKFLKLMSFILVFSFLWIINTKSAQAGFSISVPKTITMYYGQMKKITPKLYYNGEFMKNDATLWKHYGDEEIHCNCKIGNKKYVLCIDDEEVCKWSKGKWRNIGAY